MQTLLNNRSLTLLFFSASIAVAQMGGGMGGGMGSGSGSMHGPGDGTGMGAGAGMSGGMGMGSGMMNDLATGPDGTAYILRRASGNSQTGGMMQTGNTSLKTELVALDVRNGSQKWKLEIDAEMVSEPAFGKDGRIFVTVADIQGQASQSGGMMSPGGSTMSRKARLLVITATATAASVFAKTDVDSDILSAPRIAPDEAGNYVIYATGSEMSRMGQNTDDRDSTVAGQRDLYAFTPDGRVKFKVKVAQAQFNMAPGR